MDETNDRRARRPPLAAPAVGSAWRPVLLASVILMATSGVRQTVGLFVHPIVDATAMDIADVSMALAIGQLVWGVFQPVFGAWADKKGAFPVLLVGVIMLAGGQLYTARAASFPSLILAQGLLSPAGAAAGSFAILIGVIAGRLPPNKTSVASGLVNAGGSLGQFVFAPIIQGLIAAKGYAGGLAFLALSSLATAAPSWFLCRRDGREKRPPVGPAEAAESSGAVGLKGQLRLAVRHPSYLLLHVGFFTCGFHVAFLTTHLPGEIGLLGHGGAVSAISLSLIGLCNIGGSILAGVLGKYFRMKLILAALYGFRALTIIMYLLSPKIEMVFYLFAAATGLTWLATVPPTAGLVGKLFGPRYLATLFGLTLFSHQIGGFLGAWFGGLAIQASGNLLRVWHLDIALAMLAAIVNLPIREGKIVRAA